MSSKIEAQAPRGTAMIFLPTAERDKSPISSKPCPEQHKPKPKVEVNAALLSTKSSARSKGTKKAKKLAIDFSIAGSENEELYDGSKESAPAEEQHKEVDDDGRYDEDGVEAKIAGAKVATKRPGKGDGLWNSDTPSTPEYVDDAPIGYTLMN
ncbi:uncharacterized protein BCR38DRAFT_412275 [Pseudomassariella vexata]|uniref:Uncharacterized protein n=1 Tax=Pseudomassariella vexata TaxID=1141098 RepID=A0A1Y2DLG3_9PEZI|nr:uncharacterized protein BCR38DRAFT_412275 [Pseudomassariella vexata]ORY60071.1 hypothetical protein BCR38DRAFT_412275 [Pseudomassariella vexata]